MSRVLLVDDSEPNRYLLETVFAGGGYEVTSARNGKEALALAKEHPPDLVVTDILMPVMDGFDLCRQWKANDLLRRIPFVFCTANYTDPRDEEFALRLGADRFILKPLKPEALLATARELIDARRGTVPGAGVGNALPARTPYEAALARKMEALRASPSTYRGLFEACRDGLLVLDDATGRIVDANHAFERLVGRSPEELSGRTVGDAGLVADPAAFEAVLTELRSRGGVRRDLALKSPDGRIVEAEVVGSSWDADGTRLLQCSLRLRLPAATGP